MSDSSITPELPDSPAPAEGFANVGSAAAEIDDENSEVGDSILLMREVMATLQVANC